VGTHDWVKAGRLSVALARSTALARSIVPAPWFRGAIVLPGAGPDEPADLQVVLLRQEAMAPVCAPALLGGQGT
jgi:hypothetical protein